MRTTDRASYVRSISDRLGDRRLVWSGLRGDDAEPLTDIPQFSAAFSMIGRYERRSSIVAASYEELTGERPDLELYDIDDHLDEPSTQIFRRAHLRELAGPSALVPYRPSPFLTNIAFARRDHCLRLGPIASHGNAFDYKPWVETSLAELGIRTIPWRYVADEDQLLTRDLMIEGPVVLRKSRTSGGEGLTLVENVDAVPAAWFSEGESFVGVAPYLENALPLNVAGTVWPDTVSVHHPSVQLIGIDSLVGRSFGYCGNDFAAAKPLDCSLIERLERITVATGSWLRSNGYLGTFGVDLVLHDGELLFVEINPRFQGSTPASCRLAVEADEPCLMLEHVAAHLGLDPPILPPLWERMQAAHPLAHLILHRIEQCDSRSSPPERASSADVPPIGTRVLEDVRLPGGVEVAPNGVLVRLTTREQITSDGRSLSAAWQYWVDVARRTDNPLSRATISQAIQ